MENGVIGHLGQFVEVIVRGKDTESVTILPLNLYFIQLFPHGVHGAQSPHPPSILQCPFEQLSLSILEQFEPSFEHALNLDFVQSWLQIDQHDH